jgi:hypothetical protein
VRQVQLKDGKAFVATVFDLFCANYGLDRGLGGDHVARDYDAMEPYTPAWAEDHRRAAPIRSSPWPANSPRTPTRPRASRWSSSAPG